MDPTMAVTDTQYATREEHGRLETVVDTLATSVEKQGLQIESGFSRVNTAISRLADQRGVSLPQMLFGLGACVAGLGTIVTIIGAIVAGILFLAANQAKEASRGVADQLRPSIIDLQKNAVTNEERLESRREAMGTMSLAIESLNEVIEANRLVDNGQDVAISSLEQSRDEAERRFHDNEDDIEKLQADAARISSTRFTNADGDQISDHAQSNSERISRIEALLEARP